MAPLAFESKAYWHARFSSETSFEWLVPSDVFMSILEPHLQSLTPDSAILQLGFGTSDVHVHLRRRGFTNITNIDYEPLAVKAGEEAEKQAFGDVQTTYLVADALELDLGEKYALVIDKSTADAVACGGEAALVAMAQGVERHLSEQGLWISLSYSAFRFDDPGLPLEVSLFCKVPTPKQRATDPDVFHYCYALRKKSDC
ncbi:hypothetical protein QBC34DRAFT_222682 [Podospora aff. communis PSN243]|uniref:Methyltransferase domain-containing protein n=1 Tax=Podospora aff. communis PSN243 TaxID=3040156 RepID=A0AAV9G2E3_9PEZI|nr:hypothetical protein QBC34DRAFT_222682 [Podospora aff. communis PSN243]